MSETARALAALRAEGPFDDLSPQEQGKRFARHIGDTPLVRLLHRARKGQLTLPDLARRYSTPEDVARLVSDMKNGDGAPLASGQSQQAWTPQAALWRCNSPWPSSAPGLRRRWPGALQDSEDRALRLGVLAQRQLLDRTPGVLLQRRVVPRVGEGQREWYHDIDAHLHGAVVSDQRCLGRLGAGYSGRRRACNVDFQRRDQG